jgi:hypothetical protein
MDKGEGTKTEGFTLGSSVVEQLGGWDIGVCVLEGGKRFVGKELTLEMPVVEEFVRVERFKVDGDFEMVWDVGWVFVRKQCDGDKGEWTKLAGLTIGSTVVEWPGDWDTGILGSEREGCFVGKELMFETLDA